MMRLRTSNSIKAESAPPQQDHASRMLTSLGAAVILQALSDLDATRRELARRGINTTEQLLSVIHGAAYKKPGLQRLKNVYAEGWDAYKFLTSPDGAYAEIRNSWCQCAGISQQTLVETATRKYSDIAPLLEAI